MIKKMVVTMGSSFVLSGYLYAVEIQSAEDAVNIAGKQRMYTQRMLKDYAMVGMGNTFGDPSADLKKTMDDFSDHLASLKGYAKKDETKKSLEEVEKLWGPIKKELEETPSVDKVGKLQEDLEKLLKASDDATKLFAKESGNVSSQDVSVCFLNEWRVSICLKYGA